jgi:hypothetical protein
MSELVLLLKLTDEARAAADLGLPAHKAAERYEHSKRLVFMNEYYKRLDEIERNALESA